MSVDMTKWQEIAKEKNMTLADVFILYMDLQTEASMESQRKLKDTLQDLNGGDGMPMLFR